MGVLHQPVGPVGDVDEVEGAVAGLLESRLGRRLMLADPIQEVAPGMGDHNLVVLDPVRAAQGGLVEGFGTLLGGGDRSRA